MITTIDGSNFIPTPQDLIDLPKDYKSLIPAGDTTASRQAAIVYTRVLKSTKTAKKAQDHLDALTNQLAQSEGFFGKSFLRLTWVDNGNERLAFKRKTSFQLMVQEHRTAETFIGIRALIELALNDKLNPSTQSTEAIEAKQRVELILQKLDQYCQELQADGSAIRNIRIQPILFAVKQELDEELNTTVLTKRTPTEEKAQLAQEEADKSGAGEDAKLKAQTLAKEAAKARAKKGLDNSDNNPFFYGAEDTDWITDDLCWHSTQATDNRSQLKQAIDMFYGREGVPKNPKQAFPLIQQLADEDCDPVAQATLGTIYAKGRLGIKKNEQLAFQYLTKSAEQECPMGMYNLSMAYQLSIGIAQNPIEGYKWAQKAADKGYKLAFATLGYYYQHGIKGVLERNLEESFKCFEISAKDGQFTGQYNLARCYEYGRGVEKSQIMQYVYLKLAYDNPYIKNDKEWNVLVKKSFAALETQISSDDKATAIRKVDELKNEIYGQSPVATSRFTVLRNKATAKEYSTSAAGVFAVDNSTSKAGMGAAVGESAKP